MNKDAFWNIMLETSNISGGDPDSQQELIGAHLSKLSPGDIIEFDNIYNEFIDMAYDWKLWGAIYLIDGGCSDDGFMDFRGWLIGQGREVYTNALNDPDSLSELDNLEDEMDCEGYGYLASTIYEKKTGNDMPINSNRIHPTHPKGEEWEDDDLDKLFPKLFAKYGW